MRTKYVYFVDAASGQVLKVVENIFSRFTTPTPFNGLFGPEMADKSQAQYDLRLAIVRDNDTYHKPQYNVILVNAYYISKYCYKIKAEEARIRDSGLTHQKLFVNDMRPGYAGAEVNIG